MYKKQLGFQKIVCLVCVIAAALAFVYSLGIVTDLFDSLYSTMWNPDDLTQTDVPGSIIYYDIQTFNKEYVKYNIVVILTAVLLFVTNTHVRRRYYIGNYAAVGIFTVASLGVAFWSHQQIESYKHQYLTTVDFEALKEFADLWDTPYIESTFWFDAHYVVAAVMGLAVVLLIGNMVWKIVLMNAEKKLIHEGEEAAV